jgi:hypothetical protein
MGTRMGNGVKKREATLGATQGRAHTPSRLELPGIGSVTAYACLGGAELILMR